MNPPLAPPQAAGSSGQRNFKLSASSIALSAAAVVIAGSLLIYFVFVQSSNTTPVHVQISHSSTSAIGRGSTLARFASLSDMAKATKKPKKCTNKKGKKVACKSSNTTSISSPNGQTVLVGNGVSVTLYSNWSVGVQDPATSTDSAYVRLDATNANFYVFAVGTLPATETPEQLLSTDLQGFLQGTTVTSLNQADSLTFPGAPNFQGAVQDQMEYTVVANTGSSQIVGAAWCLFNTSTRNTAVIYGIADQNDATDALANQFSGMLLSIAGGHQLDIQ